MSEQLEFFKNEGYLQGYSPADKEAMEQRERANQAVSESLGADNVQNGVITYLAGSEQAKRVYGLLTDGYRHSVLNISRRLGIADPRSIIRYLRKAGVKVCDMWEQSPGGSRYKTYWIVRR